MFAYCQNNPAMFQDSCGTKPSKACFKVCIRFEDNPYEATLADYIDAKAKPLGFDMEDVLAHTISFGATGGVTSGGVALGKSYCVSGDFSGNFAWQQTMSQGASIGEGGSVGLFFAITNASDVQDLAGMSYSFGLSIYWLTGLSLEVISFEPMPGEVKWGISLVLGPGAEFSLYANENYTTSTESWHIWDLYT